MCYDEAWEGGNENMKNCDRIRTTLKNGIKTQLWNKYEEWREYQNDLATLYDSQV